MEKSDMRIHTDEPAMFRRENIKKLPVRLQPLRPIHSEKPIDLDISVNINFKINGNALTTTLPLSRPSSRKLSLPVTHARYSHITFGCWQATRQTLMAFLLNHLFRSFIYCRHVDGTNLTRHKGSSYQSTWLTSADRELVGLHRWETIFDDLWRLQKYSNGGIIIVVITYSHFAILPSSRTYNCVTWFVLTRLL